MTTIPGPECLCSLSDTGTFVAFNRMCPDHGWLAPPATEIKQAWCPGSSEPISERWDKRQGKCQRCRHLVAQKYGIAAVHLPDGSTPRE